MDKQYLKQVGKYVLSAILSVLIVAYIIYHLVNSFSMEVETMAANPVTVSETYTSDGYIFRNETVLYASDGGSVSFMYDDGTRVRRGAAVANIYTGGNTDEVNARMSEIERQITILENSGTENDVALSDSSVIDSKIDSLYYTMESKLNSGDIDYVLRRKDELLTLMNKKQVLLKSAGGFKSRLAELQSEKASLTASLGGAHETLRTEESGYLYSGTDGYEGIFTLEAADSFTVADFHKLIDAEPTVSDKAVGKVVTDFNWYLACELPSVQQQYYKVGSSYTVRFPYSGDKEVPMKLSRIVTSSEDDSIVLVFATGNVPEDFNFLRKQSVEIVQQSYTGYRIPVSCVRIVDGRQGVYIKSGNVASFREIEPLVEIDGYFIVAQQDKVNDENYASKLAMYDLVIVKGKNLYENKIIQ